MFGGINPSQMKSLMKQMGIKQEDIAAVRVIIECEEKKIIIDQPTVQKIKMQGQESFQISGESHEEALNEIIKEEDISLVSEKTGKSKEEARGALELSKGDIAQAIVQLSE